MTANPFAALLRDVPRYDGYWTFDPDGDVVRLSEVLAALAAAVPDDLADAGKVADAADIYQFWVGDNLVNLGQTIRSLLASIAAQEAQIERLEIVAQEAKAGWRDAESFSTEQKTDALKWFDLAHQNKLRAEAAETALAAEREKVARLVEAGPPFFFDRYINGVRMAEDVCVERETTLEGAMRVAARIAAKGPNGEPPVLVYRSTETAALAAITEAGQ